MPYLCDEKKREYKRKYYQKNKEKIKKRRLEQYHKTKVLKGRGETWTEEYTKEYMSKYRQENKERLIEKRRQWKKDNPDKVMAQKARRRAKKLNATPKWLTENQKKEILSFYTEAQELQVQTGTKYNVDHIIPLQGKDVCGLHVPWNLQVITAKENCEKGTSY